MVYDLLDCRKGYFDDLAVGALDLDAGRRQRLCGLHAADYAAYAVAVCCDYFYIALSVERAQGCEGFCNFHVLFTALSLFVSVNACASPLCKTDYAQRLRAGCMKGFSAVHLL